MGDTEVLLQLYLNVLLTRELFNNNPIKAEKIVIGSLLPKKIVYNNIQGSVGETLFSIPIKGDTLYISLGLIFLNRDSG